MLSVTLVVLDGRFQQLGLLRGWLETGVTPIRWLGHLPGVTQDWGVSLFTTRDALLEENEALRGRLLVLERRAQKYASVAAENNRLRELLNASSSVDDSVVVSEVIGVSPDPFTHELIIDKGRRDGIRSGQAVLDAHGLMGQVVSVGEFTARVLLISDSSHAVPVQVNRNGFRAILIGTGEIGLLELVHVPSTADILPGDLLVSSGLGGRFPKGYPVARIATVQHDTGKPFARVTATPEAQLNQSPLVLIVSNYEDMPATDAPPLETPAQPVPPLSSPVGGP